MTDSMKASLPVTINMTTRWCLFIFAAIVKHQMSQCTLQRRSDLFKGSDALEVSFRVEEFCLHHVCSLLAASAYKGGNRFPIVRPGAPAMSPVRQKARGDADKRLRKQLTRNTTAYVDDCMNKQ